MKIRKSNMPYFAYNVGGFKKRAKCAYVIKVWPLTYVSILKALNEIPNDAPPNLPTVVFQDYIYTFIHFARV